MLAKLKIVENHLCLFTIGVVLILTLACTSQESLMTGVYKAENTDSPQRMEAVLELNVNGNGLWKVGDEEVPFAWYLKGGELRVNTKGGGVIVGSISKDVIHISIPGAETMSFKRVQQ